MIQRLSNCENGAYGAIPDNLIRSRDVKSRSATYVFTFFIPIKPAAIVWALLPALGAFNNYRCGPYSSICEPATLEIRKVFSSLCFISSCSRARPPPASQWKCEAAHGPTHTPTSQQLLCISSSLPFSSLLSSTSVNIMFHGFGINCCRFHDDISLSPGEHRGVRA